MLGMKKCSNEKNVGEDPNCIFLPKRDRNMSMFFGM